MFLFKSDLCQHCLCCGWHSHDRSGLGVALRPNSCGVAQIHRRTRRGSFVSHSLHLKIHHLTFLKPDQARSQQIWARAWSTKTQPPTSAPCRWERFKRADLCHMPACQFIPRSHFSFLLSHGSSRAWHFLSFARVCCWRNKQATSRAMLVWGLDNDFADIWQTLRRALARSCKTRVCVYDVHVRELRATALSLAVNTCLVCVRGLSMG